MKKTKSHLRSPDTSPIMFRTMKPRYRIAVVMPYNQPDNRMRIVGIFDFFAAHEDAEIIVIDSSSSSFRRECDRLSSDGETGGIIFSYLNDIQPILRRQRRHKPALAMIDGPRAGVHPDVDIRLDTKALTDSVATLLKRRGYRHFAFCGTDAPLDRQYSRETERSFLASAQSVSENFVFRESPRLSFGENLKRGATWVGSLPKPCSVMCYSDELARNLLNTCKMAHINVPEQVSIIGLGNTAEICELTRPTLSSALPDFMKSGYLAAEALYQKLKAKKPGSAIHKTYGPRTIVERGSTSDLRGCGRIVTQATELMRKTPLKILTADIIATKLNISRRLLEMHFKKVLGRGVHAEISRLRLDAIRTRLVATNDSLSMISEDCGYRTANAAQIAFKKRYRTTMRAFRTTKNHGD